MGMSKRLLAWAPIRWLMVRAAAGYMGLVHATSRWEVKGGDIPARFWDKDEPFILGFWHGRLLMLFYGWRQGLPIKTVITRHRDGELLARTMERFGIGALRGSTSERGAGVLRDMVRTLKSGASICLAPDGPRGPRMRASPGVVSAARLAGVPVIPLAVSVTRRRILASWDRFLVPLPFSRGVFVWGEPIHVPRDADTAACDAILARIEAGITAVTNAADQMTGHDPLEPDPTLATSVSQKQ
jgi:lysophospholipid acyltransferase (LPLAT)-like uncharacterized protein